MSEVARELANDKLLMDHQWLVHVIAAGFKRRLPASVELDDLISWGNIGLLDAIDKYNPFADNEFKTYANFRIRGNIIDEMRRLGPFSRLQAEQRAQLERLSREIELETCQPVTDFRLAEKLKVSVTEVHRLKARARAPEILAPHPVNFTKEDREKLLASNANSGELMEKIDAMRKLERIVSGHTAIARGTFYLYNVWGLDLKEIAQVFGFSASSASQLITKVKLGLREDKE